MGRLEGLSNAIEKLQSAVDKLAQGSTQGLADALLFVGTESQNKAPVEFGDLRGSLEVAIDGTVIAKGVPSSLSDKEKKERRKAGNMNSGSGSGLVTVNEIPDGALVGSVSYNTPYAAAQHEHTEYNHPLGGQAKYLESVLTSEQDRMLQLIGGAVLNDLEEI